MTVFSNLKKIHQSNNSVIASLDNISLIIDNKKILENISCQFTAGKITTIIGPNGGGKTSIARILLRLIKASSGKVFIAEKARIGYMPQKVILDKSLPINGLDFLAILNNCKKKNLFQNNNLLSLVRRMNLENYLESSVHNLSGGQLQKLLFIQAISNNPDLLVIDEPTQYMDIEAIKQFYQIIEELRNNSKCSILLISHDLYAVMQKTDEVLCVNQHLCCSGSPSSINQHPAYLSLFGKTDDLAIYQHHHNHSH